MVKKKRITDEDIEKAFDELADEAELEKAEDDELEDEEDIEKADDEEDEEEEEDDEEEVEEDEITEDDFVEDEEEDDDEVEESVEEDLSKSKKKPIKKATNNELQKGIEVSGFLKGIVDEIGKQNTETRKVLGNVAILVKSLNERIEELEDLVDQTPRQKKSLIKKANVNERFDEEKTADGKTTLGIRKDYRQILSVLDEASGLSTENGKVDMEFAKAIQTIEARKVLPANVIKRLKDEKNIVIDPTR